MNLPTLFVKQQGQGNPLVLLHGWGFNHVIWDAIAAQLAAQWRVYQVDLPGHGRSAMCEYHLPVLLEHLAKHLPQPAVWMGWSLGGILAMALARWQPTCVKAVVLVSTSPCFITTKDWSTAMTPQALQQFYKDLQTDTVGTLRRFLTLHAKNSGQVRQEIKALHQLLKDAGYPQPKALQAGVELLLNTDLRDELQYIQCPALLCLGERDTIIPLAAGKACQHYWKQLHTAYIPSAGHIPFLSHPEIFIEIVQGFLQQHVSS